MKLLSKKATVKKVTFTVLAEKILHQVKGGIIAFPVDKDLKD